MIATHLLECLGWTLLHSLWQITLLAVLFSGTRWLLRGQTPQTNYLAAAFTMLLMLCSSLTTFGWLAADSPSTAEVQRAETPSPPPVASSREPARAPAPAGSDPHPIDLTVPQHTGLKEDLAGRSTRPDSNSQSAHQSRWTISVNQFREYRSSIEPLLPGLVVVWLAGVLLLSLRQLGGLWVVDRLRRRCTTPVDQRISDLQQTLSRRLGLRRVVTCLESARLDVPSVVGWLRPVILLPVGLAIRLPADQLEAILLHELAHIRRYDYFANGLQIVVETLLFYHPAVWWVSRRIRLEREYCADELAADASGDCILYVKALTTLEEHRDNTPQWAVAANGSDLRRRIVRLLGLNRHQPGQNVYWLSGLLVALLFVIAVALVPINADETPPPAVVDAPSSVADEQPADTPQVLPSEAAPQQVTEDQTVEEEPDEEGLFENLWYALQDQLESSLGPPIPVVRQFVFHVVAEDGRPVEGATATFTGMGLANGTSLGGFPAEILPPVATSEADGKIVIDLSKFYKSALYEQLKARMGRGVQSINLQVDHPGHPPLSASIWVEDTNSAAQRKIVLADATSIRIRAHGEHDERLLEDLYPCLRGINNNWSEDDGVLTLRRLDLTSQKASRWLRVVHAPEQGPVLFSDVIDLKQYTSNPISIEATLNPGTQVTGRLSAEVPRPIKNGRVIAAVYSGPDAHDTVFWGSLAEITPQGTFTLGTLPRDEDVQLIALCDGWVSQTPTLSELESYSETNGIELPVPSRRGYQLSGMLYPRLHRASGDSSETVIPMERTASCEVTVVDEEGHPIPDAKVTCMMFQSFFRRNGTFDLGTGWDSLAYARAHITTGKVPRGLNGGEKRSFEATTNQDGVAFIPEIAGGMLRAYDGRSFPLAVHHPDYRDQQGLPPLGNLSINLKPGESGKITVTLRRR